MNTRQLLLLVLVISVGLLIWNGVRGDAGTVSKADGVDLVVLLAPFVALAMAIERFWEAVFNYYESVAVATARLIGVGQQTATWMRGEAANAETAVSEVAALLGTKKPGDPDYDRLSKALAVAETRLQDAQTRIANLPKTPEYVAAKRAITTLGSLALGLGVGIVGRLTLLNAAGFAVAAPIDYVITGLLIGSGPGPLHSFIGTLQELRNALAGVAELARGTAVRNALQGVEHARDAAAPPGAAFEAEVAVAAPPPGTEPIDATEADRLRLRRQAARILRFP